MPTIAYICHVQRFAWVCYGYFEREKHKKRHSWYNIFSFDFGTWLPQISIAFLNDAWPLTPVATDFPSQCKSICLMMLCIILFYMFFCFFSFHPPFAWFLLQMLFGSWMDASQSITSCRSRPAWVKEDPGHSFGWRIVTFTQIYKWNDPTLGSEPYIVCG